MTTYRKPTYRKITLLLLTPASMKRTLNRLLAVSLLITASPFAFAAATLTDNFNDGNDTGWTRQSASAYL